MKWLHIIQIGMKLFEVSQNWMKMFHLARSWMELSLFVLSWFICWNLPKFFQFMETFLTSPKFEWSCTNLLKFH